MSSRQEALRRAGLARRHLNQAEGALKRGDYAEIVGHSQFSVENSAKAVIACFRVPSCSHDPSGELRSSVAGLEPDPDQRESLERLAEYAHALPQSTVEQTVVHPTPCPSNSTT